MAEQLDPRLNAIVDDITEVTGEQRFALCGGAVLDTLLDLPVADYDVVIPEENPSTDRVQQLAMKLAENGCDVPIPNRQFYAWIDRPVTLVEATRSNKVYDIAFAGYSVIPFFTIDSMHVTYPGKTVVDSFHAMQSYQNRELALARGIDQENPYLIGSRALNLAAKYDIPLQNGQTLFDELAPLLARWEPPHPFHDDLREIAAADAFKSLVRSPDQRSFADTALGSGLLSWLMPEIEEPLAELVQQHDQPWAYENKEELARDLLPLMSDEQRNGFLRRLGAVASLAHGVS